MTLDEYIQCIPKAELHVHVEGTLEPEMMVALSGRNRVRLPYATVEEIRRAYEFNNLQSFLDLYYAATEVLKQEQDFYDLTRAYLQRAARDHVRHVELFFDPQAHTSRGVSFAAVLTGIRRALDEAESKWGMTSALIMCFLRHLSEDDAFQALDESRLYRPWITAVGLDSSELGHPPSKFASVFERARDEGFRVTAHAGEEGPPAYIREALDILRAERIDHGVRCLEDGELVERLRLERIPLTVCPLSNVKLRVFPDLSAHNLRHLLDAGLAASVHSDDPAYFGGYMVDNLLACQSSLGLTARQIHQLVANAFAGSFLPTDQRQTWLATIASEWPPELVDGE